MGTYWAWETTAMLRYALAPTEGGEGRGHIVAAACLQLVLVFAMCLIYVVVHVDAVAHFAFVALM